MSQVELCNLITAWLNDDAQQQQLSQQFTAVHNSEGFIQDPQAGELNVHVSPGDRTANRIGRNEYEKRADILIGVVERINQREGAARVARQLELRELHEEIEDLVLGLAFEGAGYEPYKPDVESDTSTASNYDRSELYDDGVYSGDVFLTFTYYVKKSR